MSHAEGRKDMVKNGRRKSFGNTKIDVYWVTDKPHKVEMSKEKGKGGRKVMVAITVVDHASPKSSSKFVPEIKPCQQQFRANAFVSTL